jgi:alkanesulfonate monooxygenase SsuD/methylene tetrahydromethanopterin reductase-like flavin-dependent oxidoreductase (luciferase family)
MEFGIQFFPAVGPAQKPADRYWGEALELTRLAEELGFTNVRTVEHYFHPYGGYSPDPLIFLSAAAAVTHSIRLITGAVLPVFNHPLKLAGQIGMADAISGGRLEVGFARAFGRRRNRARHSGSPPCRRPSRSRMPAGSGIVSWGFRSPERIWRT